MIKNLKQFNVLCKFTFLPYVKSDDTKIAPQFVFRVDGETGKYYITLISMKKVENL